MAGKGGAGRTLWLLLRAMRPKQWLKNVLLFAGLLFSRTFDEPTLILRAVEAFALFCLLSGAIYLFNDVVDAEADRLHPRKKRRPVAAGELSAGAAVAAGAVFAAGALALSFLLSVPFGVVAVLYLALTLAYSQYFKHVAIVDVILLALGFVLRAVGGVVAIRAPGGPAIDLTPWFVICVLFVSLFIAICKRRHELVSMDSAENHRRVLSEYSPAFLDQMIAVSTTAAILSYALYLVAAPMERGERPAPGEWDGLLMISTFPFVIYGVFRYLYLVYRKDEGGEPESLFLRDKPLLLNTLAWLALTIFLLGR